MKRSLGYVISLIGVIILVLGIKPVNDVLSIPLLNDIPANILLIIGVVIAVIGIFVLRSSPKGKKVSEVPIYHGKDVVGFRRMGKKH